MGGTSAGWASFPENKKPEPVGLRPLLFYGGSNPEQGYSGFASWYPTPALVSINVGLLGSASIFSRKRRM